jgi:glycosyltransferase involved in cell wall biosynthesis
MASGLPVVTSAAAGASELITNGVDGVVLEDPQDERALAGTIWAILADRDHGQAMGAAARATALQYTWASVMSRVEDILMGCVA